MHRHVVMFNFKDNVSESDRAAAVAAFNSLGKLPTVKAFMVGKNILEKNDKRPYEWLIVGDFADDKARDAYEKDPHHVHVIKTEFLTKVGAYIVLDVNT